MRIFLAASFLKVAYLRRAFAVSCQREGDGVAKYIAVWRNGGWLVALQQERLFARIRRQGIGRFRARQPPSSPATATRDAVPAGRALLRPRHSQTCARAADRS